MVGRWVAVVLIGAAPLAALAQAAEPDGYRMDDYRAPVPATVEGGTVLGPEAAHEVWKAGGAVFVDVLPRAPKPAGLPEGTIWRDPPRHSIPGAIWLPNVGYGALAEATDTYFREALARATGDEFDTPLVVFCLENCWMSWNAAKRALDYGYTDVSWLPEGTDGWALWDYPLEVVTPEPGHP